MSDMSQFSEAHRRLTQRALEMARCDEANTSAAAKYAEDYRQWYADEKWWMETRKMHAQNYAKPVPPLRLRFVGFDDAGQAVVAIGPEPVCAALPDPVLAVPDPEPRNGGLFGWLRRG